jgi:D-3-phosphoglycerate dehydrogenase
MNSNILVTASHWAEPAQDRLREAGLQLDFMQGTVDEAALIQAFEAKAYAGVVLRGSCPFTADVFAAAQQLQVVAKNGAGVDNVDLQAAAAHGVAVKMAAGANADAVAEHAVTLMLALVRQLTSLDQRVRQGQWPASSEQGRDFRGSVVGIVGYGSIGHKTAQLATALGAQVLVFRRAESQAPCEYQTESDFQVFLSRLDILSLHCPLNSDTRGLIGTREIACMKPGALLINTARGPVVDEAALLAALEQGQLGGAGLDTFDIEPLPTDHPLTQRSNVILTPHVAGVTRDAALQVALMTADNILQGLNRA